jgi:hypothetical protein
MGPEFRLPKVIGTPESNPFFLTTMRIDYICINWQVKEFSPLVNEQTTSLIGHATFCHHINK